MRLAHETGFYYYRHAKTFPSDTGRGLRHDLSSVVVSVFPPTKKRGKAICPKEKKMIRIKETLMIVH
jgi:hypothetical protein